MSACIRATAGATLRKIVAHLLLAEKNLKKLVKQLSKSGLFRSAIDELRQFVTPCDLSRQCFPTELCQHQSSPATTHLFPPKSNGNLIDEK